MLPVNLMCQKKKYKNFLSRTGSFMLCALRIHRLRDVSLASKFTSVDLNPRKKFTILNQQKTQAQGRL